MSSEGETHYRSPAIQHSTPMTLMCDAGHKAALDEGVTVIAQSVICHWARNLCEVRTKL